MKPLVIYHASCADGFGAAFAAWTVLGDEAEYVAASYGAEITFNGTWHGRDLYILDFSFSRSIMEELFANANRVVWLDHHKTAFEMWCDYPFLKGNRHCDVRYKGKHYIDLNDNKSGAMLAWEFFHPGTEVPRLIQHIDDYDRWQFKLEGTKAFNKALWSYAPWDFEQWQEFFELEGNAAPERFYGEGEAILRAHDQNVQAVVKGASRMCQMQVPATVGEGFLQIPGLSANCPPHLTSDVGHELATQSGRFGLCWRLGREGTTAKCSLRSNGEYDVSAIAKAFGGGGHRNAAGFEVEISTLLSWLK